MVIATHWRVARHENAWWVKRNKDITITSFANFEAIVDDEYEFDYELHPHSLLALEHWE